MHSVFYKAEIFSEVNKVKLLYRPGPVTTNILKISVNIRQLKVYEWILGKFHFLKLKVLYHTVIRQQSVVLIIQLIKTPSLLHKMYHCLLQSSNCIMVLYRWRTFERHVSVITSSSSSSLYCFVYVMCCTVLFAFKR